MGRLKQAILAFKETFRLGYLTGPVAVPPPKYPPTMKQLVDIDTYGFVITVDIRDMLKFTRQSDVFFASHVRKRMINQIKNDAELILDKCFEIERSTTKIGDEVIKGTMRYLKPREEEPQ